MGPSSSPTSEFDAATAVARRDGGAATYDVTVDLGWTVGGKPNGGYLLAVAARAAGAELHATGTDHPDPLAATAHFLRAPDAGAAEVAVEVLRAGRSASQVRAALVQDGQTCVDATFTMGLLPDEPPAPWWNGLEPLALPPIESCVRLPARREGAPFEVAIMDRTDLRLDPAVLGFAMGRPSGAGELRGWASFADGRPADPLGLLYFLDCFPPATFDLVTSGWVPTLSLTAYVRRRPAPGPLRVRMAAQLVADGRVDEVCEIWDADDHLVAQATQLAGIRFPADAEPPARP